jgi:hypothetical protein
MKNKNSSLHASPFLLLVILCFRIPASIRGIYVQGVPPRLEFHHQKFEDLWGQSDGCCRSYWQKICPQLIITPESGIIQQQHHHQQQKQQQQQTRSRRKHVAVNANIFKQRLDEDGYYQVDASALDLSVNHTKLAQGVMALEAHGWPATFIIMYDEAWTIAHEVEQLVRKTSGGCTNNLDMLAWKIDPNMGESGFSPHRDRQPDE